jgi:hypothetical protein
MKDEESIGSERGGERLGKERDDVQQQGEVESGAKKSEHDEGGSWTKKSESVLGIYNAEEERFEYDESVLSDGEEFYVVPKKGLNKNMDMFKNKFFARLKNNPDGGEVVKCVLCRKVFEGSGVEKKEREGGKEDAKKPAVRIKLAVFYSHLCQRHFGYVKEMKKEDFPGDCDALARLRQSLEGVECGVTEKEKEEIFKKLKERKEKKKRKSKGTAEPAPATMEGVLSQPAAPAVVHLPLPPPSKRMRTGAADSASSSSSNSTGISFFAPPAASPSCLPPSLLVMNQWNHPCLFSEFTPAPAS